MSDSSSQAQLTRRTSGNALAVAGSQLVGKFATLAWLLVATRVLDQAAFGVFSFSLALALLVGSVVEWGFSDLMVQRASRNPATLNSAYTSAQALQLIFGIPAYAVAVVVGSKVADTSGASWVLLAAVVATAAETWCSTARAAASVLQRQGRVSFALTLQRLLIACTAIAALLLSGQVTSLALAFLLGTALGIPLHSLALRRAGIQFSVDGLQLARLRPLFSASHYIGISGVVLMGLAKVDQVLLGVLASDEAVGAYAPAYRLLETVFFVSFALHTALFPVLAADPRAERVRSALRAAWSVTCFAYLPYAAVCLFAAAPVLRLLFGAPYGEVSASSLQWLALVPLFFGGAFLFNDALLAIGRPLGILLAAVAALAVNVVGDLALIPHYGPAGASVATLFGYAVQMIVAAVALRKYGGLPRLFAPLMLTAAAGALVVASLLVLPLLPALLVGVPSYVLACLLLTRWLAPVRLAEARAILPVPRRRGSGASGPARGSGRRSSGGPT